MYFKTATICILSVFVAITFATCGGNDNHDQNVYVYLSGQKIILDDQTGQVTLELKEKIQNRLGVRRTYV